MRASTLCVAMAVGAAGLQLSALAAGQMAATRLDFEDVAPGALPAGFRTGLTGRGTPVKWSVVEDTSAPAGSKVLESSGDRTDYRVPVAIYQNISARDVDVTVRFKPVSGRIDQAAGVIVRARDNDNYYVVRANALESNVRLYRVVRGDRQPFANADLAIATGRWQQLGLRVEGDRFTVLFDGHKLFEASDRTFTEAGRVGLWTKADSVIYFDDFVVQILP